MENNLLKFKGDLGSSNEGKFGESDKRMIFCGNSSLLKRFFGSIVTYRPLKEH